MEARGSDEAQHHGRTGLGIGHATPIESRRVLFQANLVLETGSAPTLLWAKRGSSH